jgi:hypothetical protein
VISHVLGGSVRRPAGGGIFIPLPLCWCGMKIPF